MVKTHELKIWPEFFQPVWDRKKTFEIRWDDKGFRTNDYLHLKEWYPPSKEYTGRNILATVEYLMAGGVFGLKQGWVAMAIKIQNKWKRMKQMPMTCTDCGRFIGKDGYPDVIYDEYMGGYEAGYPRCGPCGRQLGFVDKRKKEDDRNIPFSTGKGKGEGSNERHDDER